MRVAFNAVPLAATQLRGWTRYTVNLLATLPRQGVRPVLLARGPLNPDHLARLPSNAFDMVVAPPMSYTRWEQNWVPRACRTARVDLFHCPLNFGVPTASSAETWKVGRKSGSVNVFAVSTFSSSSSPQRPPTTELSQSKDTDGCNGPAANDWITLRPRQGRNDSHHNLRADHKPTGGSIK